MMTEQEAKEFMAKPLPERFHDFMLMEMCDEDGFNEMMRNKPSVRDFSKRMRYYPSLQRKTIVQRYLGFYAYRRCTRTKTMAINYEFNKII